MRAAPKRRPERAVGAEVAEAEEDVKGGEEEDVKGGEEEGGMVVWWVGLDEAQEEDPEEDVGESGMVARWTWLEKARCSWRREAEVMGSDGRLKPASRRRRGGPESSFACTACEIQISTAGVPHPRHKERKKNKRRKTFTEIHAADLDG